MSSQLDWQHFLKIICIKDDLKRDFYAKMCRLERWSVRTLRTTDWFHAIGGSQVRAMYLFFFRELLIPSIL